MFVVKFFKNENVVHEKDFSTVEKAEEYIGNNEYYDRSDHYEIIDLRNNTTILESEIVAPDDVLKDMFDDEDSKEGFDWTMED